MTNPIPSVLDKIPYVQSLLDLELADTLIKQLGIDISNEQLLILLLALKEVNLIELDAVKVPTTPGTLVLIKRL